MTVSKIILEFNYSNLLICFVIGLIDYKSEEIFDAEIEFFLVNEPLFACAKHETAICKCGEDRFTCASAATDFVKFNL